jgi:hypothetical protein
MGMNVKGRKRSSKIIHRGGSWSWLCPYQTMQLCHELFQYLVNLETGAMYTTSILLLNIFTTWYLSVCKVTIATTTKYKKNTTRR